MHHLAHQLPDRRNTVILTGYQADGTRGRQLVEGARQVKIHGRYVPVRAEIVDVPELRIQIEGMLDPSRFTGRAAEQVDIFLRNEVDPVLKRHETSDSVPELRA